MPKRVPGSKPRRGRCANRDAVTLLRDPSGEMSASNSPRRTGPPPNLLFLLIAMTAIGPLSLNILVPAVPGLVLALSTDTAAVQLTISLYLLGLAAAQLVLGPLSDRFGRRPVVLAGLALTAISSAAAIITSSIAGLIISRVIQSIGASVGIVVGRAIIRDLVDREHTAATIGLVTTAMVVAPMVAPLIGGLLDTAFGWQAIFIFVAVSSALVFVWALLVLPETRKQHIDAPRRHFWSDLRLLFSSKEFLAYVAASTFASGSFFVFLGGAPHVSVTMMGRTSAEYGAWFMLNSIGYMSGTFLAARLSVRYGLDKMIHWGLMIQLVMAGMAAVLAAFFFSLGPAIIFIPQLLISLGNGMVIPNAVAGAVSVRPEMAGTASGITGFVQMAFGAGMAQLAAWLVAGASSGLPLPLTMVAISIVGVASFWWLLRK
jgi:DHA1 family bicyclomycin/chloramphenicol resistance-like MFS transporter